MPVTSDTKSTVVNGVVYFQGKPLTANGKPVSPRAVMGDGSINWDMVYNTAGPNQHGPVAGGQGYVSAPARAFGQMQNNTPAFSNFERDFVKESDKASDEFWGTDVYAKDDKGNILKDANNKPIIITKGNSYIDPKTGKLVYPGFGADPRNIEKKAVTTGSRSGYTAASRGSGPTLEAGTGVMENYNARNEAQQKELQAQAGLLDLANKKAKTSNSNDPFAAIRDAEIEKWRNAPPVIPIPITAALETSNPWAGRR